MKRIYLIVFSFSLLLSVSGCESAIQSPTPDVNLTDVVMTVTHLADRTPTPTITSTPEATATSTPIVFTSDTETLFRDDFNAELKPGWQWLNENPINWSLVNIPGSLQIQAEPGYINFGNAKNLLLRPAPQGDFFVETSVNFLPDESDQFAGVVLFESITNFAQAGLGYCLPAVGCLGQGHYLDIYQNGIYALPRNPTQYFGNTLAIRLVVEGNMLSLFTSPDGKAWYRSYQRSINFNIQQVGLFAGQNNDTLNIPATFEYFEIGRFK